MDMHFYYYATCLAARLAGMKPDECQQLAYYCQTMSEMQSGTTALSPWQYQNYQFTPCAMGARKADLESRAEYNHELAFTRLPALLPAKQVAVFSREALQLKSKTAPHNHQPTLDQVTRHYYNPLTDVDWQQGGRFKSAFSRKLAHKHSLRHNRQAETQESSDAFANRLQTQSESRMGAAAANMKNHIGYADSRLNCAANSQFSRDMLNDTIFKSRYRSPVKGIELALLGCRLSVYQNTWQTAEISKLADGSAEKRVHSLLDAFYWSVYVIECFLQNRTVENIRQWRQSVALDSNHVLAKQLKALFAMNGASLQREYMWLSQFSQLIAGRGTDWSAFTNWREGLRYRPQHLLEQALLQSGTDQQRQITDLQGFKNSAFYKLNVAAQYHIDWLAKHLSNNGLASYACSQKQGEHSLWQQI